MNAKPVTSEPVPTPDAQLFELVLLVPEPALECISDALLELDALSVSVEDADAMTSAESAIFGEPGMPAPKEGWQRSRVMALFAQENQAQAAAQCLALQDFFENCRIETTRAVPAQDWVRLTQSQFAPVQITPNFWVVPTWHAVPAAAQHVIRLDPGLAFGTGTHPTTRMCLRWLAQHGNAGLRVLDYGCGSGILAIGAAKLGAADVVAVDIDPAAVAATKLNAAANAVQLTAGLPELAQGHFDWVLANILAMPLTVLAPLLCAHVRSGGHLVLAGILARQAEALRQAYAPWVALQVSDEEEGWVLMTAIKP